MTNGIKPIHSDVNTVQQQSSHYIFQQSNMPSHSAFQCQVVCGSHYWLTVHRSSLPRLTGTLVTTFDSELGCANNSQCKVTLHASILVTHSLPQFQEVSTVQLSQQVCGLQHHSSSIATTLSLHRILHKQHSTHTLHI